MLLEGRIETTSFPKTIDLQSAFGLDTCTRFLKCLAFHGKSCRCKCTAGEHRLLDQRTAFETNCQVSNKISLANNLDTVVWEHTCAGQTCPECTCVKDTCPARTCAQDTSAGHAFAQHTEKCASEQDDFCYVSPRLTELESVPLFKTCQVS